MKAIVVCSGSMHDTSWHKKIFNDCDIVIGVDGGALHLRRLGIVPDILIGDFDSISNEDLEYFTNLNVKIQKYPTKKDMTDTELALEYAVEVGAKSLVMLGCLGTRLDHSLSNIFHLKKLLKKGVRASIVDEHNEIFLIDDSIKINRENNTKVTLLALSETVEGVTTRGLCYGLNNEVMELGSSWGVSNEFEDDSAEISISSGLLLVIKSRDSY